MQNWWYDRDGPRADDEGTAFTVGMEILAAILIEMQTTRPALKYQYDAHAGVYRFPETSFLFGVHVVAEADPPCFAINLITEADDGGIMINFTKHDHWNRVSERIDEMLLDDAAYQRRAAHMCETALRAEIATLQQMLRDVLPIELCVTPGPDWTARQQALLATHQALVPNGDGARTVATHFADLQQ